MTIGGCTLLVNADAKESAKISAPVAGPKKLLAVVLCIRELRLASAKSLPVSFVKLWLGSAKLTVEVLFFDVFGKLKTGLVFVPCFVA